MKPGDQNGDVDGPRAGKNVQTLLRLLPSSFNTLPMPFDFPIQFVHIVLRTRGR